MVRLEILFAFAVGDDAGAFLPAMLEGVEAEKGDLRRVGMTEHGEDAAFILGTVLKDGSRRRFFHYLSTYTPSAAKEKRFTPF